jgi:polyhydroxybutyrate depolymerase
MRIFLLSLVFIGLSISGIAQQIINGSIMHDGSEREYILYVPESYSAQNPVPLVMNYHGYGSNAGEQMFYGDFRSIADTAGFLIVHPEGLLYNGISHWNVGGWIVGDTTDDVGFADALIDSLSDEYSIDPTKIYSTGMSNGGFMSFLLACQLSDRIAAIGSVTGSMTPENYDDCSPLGPAPILQIHGTNDALVPYGGAIYSKPINDVLEYWVSYNNCVLTPEIIALPDIDPNDGSTVEHYTYNGGSNGVTVEHYKVTGGEHTWPGSAFGGTGTNYDIDASVEIWKFFSKYDINGLIGPTGIPGQQYPEMNVSIYPNPFNSSISIKGDFPSASPYKITSLTGKQLTSGTINFSDQKIDLSQLPAGIYVLRINNRNYKLLKTQ